MEIETKHFLLSRINTPAICMTTLTSLKLPFHPLLSLFNNSEASTKLSIDINAVQLAQINIQAASVIFCLRSHAPPHLRLAPAFPSALLHPLFYLPSPSRMVLFIHSAQKSSSLHPRDFPSPLLLLLLCPPVCPLLPIKTMS